jgi:hypothetical protein
VEVVGGKITMCNGLFTFMGAPADGVELDPEGEFDMEYGRPEGDLRLINFQGCAVKVRAWITTADGPQVVLESTLENGPVAVLANEVLHVVGPSVEVF